MIYIVSFAAMTKQEGELYLGDPSVHSSWDEAVQAARERLSENVVIDSQDDDEVTEEEVAEAFDAETPGEPGNFTVDWSNDHGEWTTSITLIEPGGVAP